MTIYKDKKKGFHLGKGHPSKLDGIAKLDFVKTCRDLAFPAGNNNIVFADATPEMLNEVPLDLKPRPPKRSMIRKLLQQGAKDTLARSGRILEKNEKVKVGKTTIYLLRRNLTNRVKAKDLTDPRYLALSDYQHLFQSCVMTCVLYLDKVVNNIVRYYTPEQVANFDITTFQLHKNESNQVRKCLICCLFEIDIILLQILLTLNILFF